MVNCLVLGWCGKQLPEGIYPDHQQGRHILLLLPLPRAAAGPWPDRAAAAATLQHPCAGACAGPRPAPRLPRPAAARWRHEAQRPPPCRAVTGWRMRHRRARAGQRGGPAAAAEASCGRSPASSEATTSRRCGAASSSTWTPVRAAIPCVTSPIAISPRSGSASRRKTSRVWPRVQDRGRSRRGRQDVPPPGAPVRPHRLALRQQTGRAARQQGHVSAGSLADHQGSRRRQRISVCPADRLRRPAGWRRSHSGHVLQSLRARAARLAWKRPERRSGRL